jgi:hypothetical protein
MSKLTSPNQTTNSIQNTNVEEIGESRYLLKISSKDGKERVSDM